VQILLTHTVPSYQNDFPSPCVCVFSDHGKVQKFSGRCEPYSIRRSCYCEIMKHLNFNLRDVNATFYVHVLFSFQITKKKKNSDSRLEPNYNQHSYCFVSLLQRELLRKNDELI
jgi:hypothetical protein